MCGRGPVKSGDILYMAHMVCVGRVWGLVSDCGHRVCRVWVYDGRAMMYIRYISSYVYYLRNLYR